MSERMTIECACERGGNCTSISACSADSMLEDQADEYEMQINTIVEAYFEDYPDPTKFDDLMRELRTKLTEQQPEG